MDHRALPLHEMPTVWRRASGEAGREVRSGRDDRGTDRSLPCDLSRPAEIQRRPAGRGSRLRMWRVLPGFESEPTTRSATVYAALEGYRRRQG